jgi:hypothetical protein
MRLGSILVTLLLFAVAPQAWAKGRVDSLERVAKKACAAGDFRKGVDILADLYVRTDDPTFVFNQGRCYEQNHQWESAIDRFREYLRQAKHIGSKVRADVEKHITDCRRFQEEESSRPRATAASSRPLPPATVSAPARLQAPRTAERSSARRPDA